MVVVTAQVYRDCIDSIDYVGLLPLYRPAMQRYVERGHEPGEALMHVLQNDLRAVLLFDDPLALHAVVRWVNRQLPLPIWGDRQTVQNWMRLAHIHSRGVSSPIVGPGGTAQIPGARLRAQNQGGPFYGKAPTD